MVSRPLRRLALLATVAACIFLNASPAHARSAYRKTTGTSLYLAAYAYGGNVQLHRAQLDGSTSFTTSWTVPLPFAFNFYGVDYDAATISSAGYLTFGGQGNVSQNTTLPAATTARPMIAPFWDALSRRYHGDPKYEDANIYHVTIGNAPNRVFLVSWFRVGNGYDPHWFNNTSFNVELHENGHRIRFHYGPGYYSTSYGTFTATAGLQDATGTNATCAFSDEPPCSHQLTPNSYAANDFVEFTRIEDHGVVSVSGPASAAAGETITVHRTIENTGGFPMGPRGYRIFLSTDATITATDTLLHRGTIPALAPGESDSNADTFLLDFGGAPGDYYFGVLLDGTDAVPGNDARAAENSSAIAVPLAITGPATLPDAIQSVPLPGDSTYRFKAVGPGTTRHWSVSEGSLPAGLSLDTATARLEGVPTTPTGEGGQSFTISVSNGVDTASREYNLVVHPRLTITTTALPDGAASTVYAARLEASGFEGATWSLASGTLPAGLTLHASTGDLTGTLSSSSAGTYTPRFRAAAGGQTAEATLPITVHPRLTVTLPGTSTQVPDAVVGQSYSVQPTISGGDPNERTATLASGELPPGLSLDASSGAIQGIPSTTGSWTFTLRVVSGLQTVNLARTIAVFEPLLVLDTSLPPAVEGRHYEFRLTATGGTGAYGWTIGGASPLFSGLSLDAATGLLTGTPTAPGSPNPRTLEFTVTSGSQTVHRELELQVVPRLSLEGATPPWAVRGADYTYRLPVSGGMEEKHFSVTNGVLPPGLTLDPATGLVQGIASSAGSFTCTVQVTSGSSAADQTATATYTFTVSEPLVITTGALPDGLTGRAYSASLSAVGGTGHFIWSALSLPAGLALSPSGLLAGTPAQAGTFRVEVRVADGHQVVERSIPLTVAQGGVPFAVATRRLHPALVGTPYETRLQVRGGEPPYAWTSGALPPGFALDPEGLLAGTATAEGHHSLTFTVTDSQDRQASATLGLLIADPAAVTVVEAPFPAALAGVAYEALLTAIGGTGPYTWTLEGGELPEGITLTSEGALIGTTASAPGLFRFTVKAVDAEGREGSAALVLTLGREGEVLVLSDELPTATEGSPYTAEVIAAGGTAPLVFSVTAGLPPGLAMASDGWIEGTPSAPGDFAFTVQADDAEGLSGTRELAIEVRPQQRGAVAPCGCTGTAPAGLMPLLLIALILRRRR